MQISPISNNNYLYGTNIANNKTRTASTKSPAFKSVFGDITPQNTYTYHSLCNNNPDFLKLRLSSTRIFRELPVQNAITKLLPQNEKSEIKILGCSDGSEAWAYAIMAKENMGENAKNVNVVGVDNADYLIETAKTGKIVCSDIEKWYTIKEYKDSGLISPIFGNGWDKYLKLCPCPKEVEALKEKEPCMKFIDYNPVEGNYVGHGNNWYEINKEGLPDVSFKTGDMFDNLEPANKDAKNVVYVIANTGAYILEQDPEKFLKLFSDIKEKNKGKNVYVVLGQMEHIVLKQKNPGIRVKCPAKNMVNRAVEQMGYKEIGEKAAKKFGSKNYEEVSQKILKLQ